MSTNMITFANTGPLLRAAGYIPAPCDEATGMPLGPFMARQWPYAKHRENDELPVAVLTCLPPARNELENSDYRGTWLVSVRVSIRPELVAYVDRIVKRYIGKSRCPVLVGDDGAPVYVFRPEELPTTDGIVPADMNWSGPGFSFPTDGRHAPDRVVVEIAASYLPVGRGNWRDGIDLLDIPRGELPDLTPAKADALVKEVNALLDKHGTPAVAARAPYAPKPLLADVAELRFGHRREIAHLRKYGYQPAPVVLGKNIRPRLDAAASQLYDGYPTDREEWAGCGVGLLTNYRRPNVNFDRQQTRDSASWLVELQVRTKHAELRAVIDATIVARLGQSPVRVGLGGEERLYLFARDYGVQCEPVDFLRSAGVPGFPSVPGTKVTIRVAQQDTLLVSGLDNDGMPYAWERGSVLTTPRNALPRLDTYAVSSFIQAVESLLESGRFTTPLPAPRRGRKAAS